MRQSVSVSSHGFEDVGVVVACHIVQVLIDTVFLLEALDESGQGRHTGLSNAVVSSECSEA